MFKRFFKAEKDAKNLGFCQQKSERDFQIAPEKVDGQKGGTGAAGNWQFRSYKIIYSTGPGGFSVAVGHSHSDSPAACGRLLAIRWNGKDGNDLDIGFPKNTDQPNWFPIPREFSAIFLSHLETLRELDTSLQDPSDLAQKVPFPK